MASFTAINEPVNEPVNQLVFANVRPETTEPEEHKQDEVIIPHTPSNESVQMRHTHDGEMEIDGSPIPSTPVPQSEPSSTASTSEERYNKRKERFARLGLCMRCSQSKNKQEPGSPSAPGSAPNSSPQPRDGADTNGKGTAALTACTECSLAHNAKVKDTRKRRQEEGLCGCGHAVPRPGFLSCEGCASRQKDKRANRREQGLCTLCGKAAPPPGRTRCERCKTRQDAAAKKRRDVRRLHRQDQKQEGQQQQQTQQEQPQQEEGNEKEKVQKRKKLPSLANRNKNKNNNNNDDDNGDREVLLVVDPHQAEEQQNQEQPVPKIGQDKPWRRISIQDILN